MKVRDIMSSTVRSAELMDSIGHAAREMADHDIGMLPVLDGANLVGVVTDRDIAVRAVAAGIAADAPVRRIMSEYLSVCSPDDDVETVLETMGAEQIRRMPVCNEFDEVIGVIALADIAERGTRQDLVGDTLSRICTKRGAHSQTFTRVSVEA